MPDPQIVLDCLDGFRRSKVMFTAAKLGVFDVLEGATHGSRELAKRFDCREEALARLLDACVGLGLLEKRAGMYRNSEVASKYLARSSAESLVGYALYSETALYPLWGKLDDAVREGSNRWHDVFGGEDNFFANVYSKRSSMRDFIAGMHGFGVMSSPAVVAAVDLSGFRKMVDLGGGSGHLAIEACRRNPELRAVVFDLPSVCEVAREMIAAAGMSGQVKTLQGDFFRDELPRGDLYALSRIIHDWDEARIQLILRKCFDLLPRGGAVLIAERLLNDDKTGPAGALLQSLNMLVATHGRERTGSEYRELLANVGFREVTTARTGSVLDAILARK